MKIEQNILVIALISILLFAIIGLILLQTFAPPKVIATISNAPKNSSGSINTPTEAEAFTQAQNFILNSETYKYDGSKLEYVTTKPTSCQFCWAFTFTFESSHGGYGDRTNSLITQVITPHTATVTIENGAITSAILDETWDMHKQKIIQDEETNNASHVVINADNSTTNVDSCESSLITCGCYTKGMAPENQGLLGGINCYGLYGLTGCESSNGVCFAVYEHPGLKVNKSVYAMSETVNITYLPPVDAIGSTYDCKKPWKVERYLNGKWSELKVNKFDNYFECQPTGPEEKTNTCKPKTIAYTQVYRDVWDLNYWLEEPQMCNGAVFTGIRKVNAGPGHYRITWNDSTAEFQITS